MKIKEEKKQPRTFSGIYLVPVGMCHRNTCPRRYASLGPSRARTGLLRLVYQASWCRFAGSMLPCTISTFPVSLSLTLILAMSSRVYLFFPPHGHGPPPTPRDRFNLYICLQRHRFPIPRYAKHPGITRYAIGPLFLLHALFSPHCTFNVSEHDLFWQTPAAHSDERPRPQASSWDKRCLNALTSSYLEGTVLRGHPMAWSLALCPDDTKHDR